MATLRGKVVPWTAPSNKGDAARYWGHSGEFTLEIPEEIELPVRNAIGGVILRTTESVDENSLAACVGAMVEVEGDFFEGHEKPVEHVPMTPTPVTQQPMQAVASASVPQYLLQQTLMQPSRMTADGVVEFRPAPHYEGGGLLVRSIRKV